MSSIAARIVHLLNIFITQQRKKLYTKATINAFAISLAKEVVNKDILSNALDYCNAYSCQGSKSGRAECLSPVIPMNGLVLIKKKSQKYFGAAFN